MKYRRAFILATLIGSLASLPQTQAQQKIIFNGGDRNGFHDASWGFSEKPDSLELISEKLPADTTHPFGGVSTLRLKWTSTDHGAWGAAVAAPGWRPYDVTVLDSLSFRLFSETGIDSAALPCLYLEDIEGGKTKRASLSQFVHGLRKGEWTVVVIPCRVFDSGENHANLRRIKTVFFGHGANDGVGHTLWIADMRVHGGAWITRYHNVVVLGSTGFRQAEQADSSWVNRYGRYVTVMDSTWRVVNLTVSKFSSYRVMPDSYRPPVGRGFAELGMNISTAMTYLPSAIIISVADEDVACGYPISEQIANYDTLFWFAESHKVPLWITTPQPVNFPSAHMRQLLSDVRDSVLERYSTSRVIDFWSGLADSSGRIRPEYDVGDGIRLNSGGSAVLMERVKAAGVFHSGSRSSQSHR